MTEVAILVLCLIAISLHMPIAAQVMILLIALILVLPGAYATMRGAPFVPTTRLILQAMMRLADVQQGEKVYDLGCGDGRLVFAAARAGAHAVGYELSVPVFVWAKLRSLLHPKSRIAFKNFWKQDYRDADVVFCFLLVSTMQTFHEIVWPQLKPGCRVVSHAFAMKDVQIVRQEGNALLYVK